MATLLARSRVVLVGTSNPENVGAAARLAANFELAPLTFVAPRVAIDHQRALVVGRAALARIERARVVATLEEAVAETSFVVGFSARRGNDRPFVELRRLGARVAERAPSGEVALVFGPEDTGLQSDDLARCDLICEIDLPGALRSLNVAQAMAIVAWELARPSSGEVAALQQAPTESSAAKEAERQAATRAELEALLDHAAKALAAIDPRTRDAAVEQGAADAGAPTSERERRRTQLRRLLGKAALTRDEVRGLHGLCEQVLRAVARR